MLALGIAAICGGAHEMEDEVQPKGVIEAASSGRAKCRACGRAISKGELRLGDKQPNPFGDGEATYWFHLECAAYRRPDVFAAALQDDEELRKAHSALLEIAHEGIEHPRLTRLARLEQAPSGRARCRQCREAIPKQGLRLALDIFQDGRFDPIGFVHFGCQQDYFGVSVSAQRVARAAGELEPELVEQAVQSLSDSPDRAGD
jgi:hypothetical protein